MNDRQTPHFTVEKQRRPSPRVASSENSSLSPSYSSGPESSATPARGDSGAAARSPGVSHLDSTPAAPIASTRTPLHHRGGAARHGVSGGGTFGSTIDTATFTPPASVFTSTPEYGRAMAHLLDSVTSHSPASLPQTPPRSSSSLPGHSTAYFSSCQRHPQRQEHRWSTDVQTAAQTMRQAKVEGSNDGVSEWNRFHPMRQQHQQREQQQQQHDHHRTQRHNALPASQKTRQRLEATAAEPTSTYASTNSVNDETSSNFSATPLPPETCERHGSEWASPSEVLQLRAACQDVVSRYTREVLYLKNELAKAREECAAYARERSEVRKLQQVYQDGVEACGKAKEREAQWVEERALLHVQMEKIMVENQRLQVYIAKKHRPHAHPMPARGGATGKRERVRGALQAVESAAAAAMPSDTPSLISSWPPLAPTTTSTTTIATGSLASPQSLDGPDSKISSTPLSTAMAAGAETAPEEATSPYTFLSSASSPPPLPQAQQDNERQGGDGRAAAAALLLSLSPPISGQCAPTVSILPTVAAGTAGAHSPHANLPQSSSASDAGNITSTGLPDGDGSHTSPSPQEEDGHTRRPPRGRADHDEGPHMSSLITPSLYTSSEAVTSRSVGAAAAGVVSSSDDDGRGSGRSERPPRKPRVGVGREGDVGDRIAREGDFSPSYARGVTEVSSTSSRTTSSSPAAAMHAMLVGDSFMPGLVQPVSGHSGRGSRRNAERGGDGVAAASEAANMPPPSSSGVAAAAGFPINAATSLTTGMTLSAGSTATATASSSWGLQYLYQLPRTPAEALQEEMRMLKELQRLGEENHALQARVEYVEAMKEIHTNRCEQQRLRLAQEHDLSRHSAAQWELSSQQLESEVRQSRALCAELKDTLEDVLQQAKRQQELSQARLVELEANCRAALMAARDEAMAKVGALRCTLQEILAGGATTSASASSAAASHEVVQLREETGQLQRTIESLRAELHALRATHTALQDEHNAWQAEVQMCRTRLEGDLASSRELLAASCRDKQGAELCIDQLEAEVARLRASVGVSEGCMHAMEERLRIATGELTSLQEQLDEAAMWQARALSAENELSTQRDYYEREIDIYKTAASAMRDRHQNEMMDLAKRHEKLQIRYEAARVRLAAAVSRSGAAALFSAVGSDTKTRRSRHGKKEEGNLSVNTLGDRIDSRSPVSSAAAIKTEPSPSHSAVAAYDSLQALRTSGQATEQLIHSLNRSTSPYL
ncbi:hypothetical protein JKF63_05438 [Porcisia hertigi]|uniref:Uncharacterized protein n=1 Tax=Porcisia hertigi TaxID=2761500 RepID=A0A836IYH1_9TRYP|nr:hypothetical protein JKF63_05438 [Porcisia hertigi]